MRAENCLLPSELTPVVYGHVIEPMDRLLAILTNMSVQPYQGQDDPAFT